MDYNDRAAEIAVWAVKEYRAGHKSDIQVIFNAFKDVGYENAFLAEAGVAGLRAGFSAA